VSVAAALVPRLAVEPHTEFEVLTDRVRRESANLDDRRTAEYPERARDDQQTVDRAPTGSGGEKRPEVFHGLKHRQRTARKTHLHDVTLVDVAAVGDADDPACTDSRRALDERPHGRKQSIGLDDRVRVHATDKWTRRRIHGRVQSIRATAVGLIDHHQVRVDLGSVHTPDRLSCDSRSERLIHAPQREGRDQTLERGVGRTVVG